jgi:FtsH-binding integral membrane protein
MGVPSFHSIPVLFAWWAAIAASVWKWYDVTIVVIVWAVPFVVIMFRRQRIGRRRREDVEKRRRSDEQSI